MEPIELTGGLQGFLCRPTAACGLGVVVLGGGSGRVDVARAGVFAGWGAVAIAQRWRPGQSSGPVRYREMFERSLGTFAEDVPAATIPMERSCAEFILIGGENDAIWPSADFARRIAGRLQQAGRACRLITHPHAGRRVVLPGEPVIAEPAERAWGGSEEADRELGGAAWRAISEILRFTPAPA